jgi:hypothetical protein
MGVGILIGSADNKPGTSLRPKLELMISPVLRPCIHWDDPRMRQSLSEFSLLLLSVARVPLREEQPRAALSPSEDGRRNRRDQSDQ